MAWIRNCSGREDGLSQRLNSPAKPGQFLYALPGRTGRLAMSSSPRPAVPRMHLRFPRCKVLRCAPVDLTGLLLSLLQITPYNKAPRKPALGVPPDLRSVHGRTISDKSNERVGARGTARFRQLGNAAPPVFSGGCGNSGRNDLAGLDNGSLLLRTQRRRRVRARWAVASNCSRSRHCYDRHPERPAIQQG
jgi:hypothetical protein